MDELVRRGITQLKEKEGAETFSRELIERYQWPLVMVDKLYITLVLLSLLCALS
ncbi:MAG TPA: hypothetical protein VFU37_11310 [Pyrinomonadaceae bacterium]|nr:hypothetical protein [Pyrinomonadaceae bacterium]